MAAGKVKHWKHGWIPVSPEAKAYVAGRGPKPSGSNAKAKGRPTPPKLALSPRSGKPRASVPRPTIARVGKTPKEVTGKSLLQGGQAEGMLDSIQKNGGFTYDPRKGGLVEVGGNSAGFAIAVPGTETVVGVEKVSGKDITREDFARGIADVITKNKDKIAKGAVLGGWYSPERNTYMVELTDIFPADDREGAIQAGKDRNQEAIFDLATGETIITGGSGDQPDLEPDRDSLNILTREMSPEERSAAKYYSGPGFTPLNSALRTGTEPSLPVKAYQDHLDKLLANSRTNQQVTTYRGLKSWPGFPTYMAPGTTYSDRGYMSTAVADAPPENYTGDVTMAITIPEGANALDMNAYKLSHHPEERELLLPHGSEFRILSDVKGADGKRMISMELISGLPGGNQQ